MCDCGSEIESTHHLLLHCPFFKDERKKLFENLQNIKPYILEFQKDFLTNILLFGSNKFEETINGKVIQSKITNLKLSSRLKDPYLTNDPLFVSLNKEEKTQIYYLVFLCYLPVSRRYIYTFFISLQLRSL